MPIGLTDLHLAARDAYGNTIRHAPRSVLVIPRWGLAPLTLFLWCLLALAIVGLAPWWKPCMTLLMFPVVRRWGSLWAIFLALSFASTRRYLLGRYTRELHKHSGQGDPQSPGPDLYSKLAESSKLRLTGEPGARQHYFNGLTHQLTTGKVNERPLQNTTPIFLPLKLYKEKEKISAGATSQLSKLGGITDALLAKTFLDNGKFIYLLDGLEDLDEKECSGLERFLFECPPKNFIVVGTDGRSSCLPDLTSGITLDSTPKSSEGSRPDIAEIAPRSAEQTKPPSPGDSGP